MADKNKIKALNRSKKKMHIRKKVRGSADRPRLVVFRSAKNIYAQLVDDVNQRTLTTISTLSPDLKAELNEVKNKIDAAKVVGKFVAQKATELKIKNVVFDRGGYLYHGRVRAVAESARENGLSF